MAQKPQPAQPGFARAAQLSFSLIPGISAKERGARLGPRIVDWRTLEEYFAACISHSLQSVSQVKAAVAALGLSREAILDVVCES